MDPALLRILDANLNRAREAFRTLEEHVRFVLDDAALTARVKQCRHDLAAVSAALPGIDMLANRDIEHDVGASVTTPTEGVRTNAGDVAAASAGRATEALRCLEEYGKVIDPALAARFEQLRYAVYALERDIVVTGPRRARLRDARLHVLLTEALCSGPWLGVAEAAIAGGADVLQLREKSLPDGELLDRARRLRTLTAARGALFFVNDRPDIARLAGADGVHVGQDDLTIPEVRRIAGPTVLVGISTHSVEQARAALDQRPDYVAVGPMFTSPTKPAIVAQGPSLLSAVRMLADCPVVAIGGITPANVRELETFAGIQIAVCQAVISRPDPAAAARELLQAL
ncbi:MAG: thiamine phosphate synthase [Phycisphaerae bacterium]